MVKHLRHGNYFETACAVAGISRRRAYKWIEKGRKAKSGIYYDFYRAVEQAIAYAETVDMRHITRAAKDSWQAAAWRRERSAPRRWGHGRDSVEDILRGPEDLDIDPATTFDLIAAKALKAGDLQTAMAAVEKAAHLRGQFPADKAALARMGLDTVSALAIEAEERFRAIMMQALGHEMPHGQLVDLEPTDG